MKLKKKVYMIRKLRRVGFTQAQIADKIQILDSQHRLCNHILAGVNENRRWRALSFMHGSDLYKVNARAAVDNCFKRYGLYNYKLRYMYYRSASET